MIKLFLTTSAGEMGMVGMENTPVFHIGNDEKGMKRSECPGKRMKRFNL